MVFIRVCIIFNVFSRLLTFFNRIGFDVSGLLGSDDIAYGL